MKKYTILLSSLLALSLQGQNILPDNEEYYQPYIKPIDGLYHTFALGASSPMGNWGASPSATAAVTDPFVGASGMGAGFGYFLYFYQHVPFNFSADLANTGYWGLRWGVDIADHGALDWQEVLPGASDFDATNALNVSFLLAPTYNYNINNRLVVEGAAHLYLSMYSQHPGIVYPASTNDDGFEIIPESAPEGSDIGWTPGYGLSVGLRIKYVRFFVEYYNQAFNRYYEYRELNANGGESEPTGFNSDYTVRTLRYGVGITF